MNKELFLTALLSYFVIVDPIGTSIIFATLTAERDAAYGRKMALRAVLLSVAIIICFGFFGARFLAYLGITIESFRIAGGLLLFYTAFNMITRDEGLPTERTGSIQEDISFFPMSFPLIAGPGCLTLTVLLFAGSELQPRETVALLAAIFIIFSLTFICFLFAKKLSHLIGQVGNNIVRRLLGVVLAALSIQFIVDGIMGLMK